MKFTSLLFAFFGLCAFAPIGRAVAITPTATLTPDSAYLLPAGGTATFTAAVSGYTDATTAIGWTVTLPAGWAYASGTNEPAIKPESGRTTPLEWAYTTVPTSGSFTFSVTYPAGISSNQTVSSSVIVRAGGTPTTVTPTSLTLMPATAPTITSATTASATVGSAFSYTITASSPIALSGYAASGLPAGLSLNSATGVISGTPTTPGTTTVTLTATNAAGSGTTTLVLTTSQGNATVTLGNLTQTYSGSPLSVSATTVPSGLTVAITYAGSTTAPTAAGTYAVAATITDAGYQGTASGTLTIAQATQSLTFTLPATATLGTPLTLAATASSGLPVTFSVLSGPASVTGSVLTLTGTGTVVVRASQSGNNNLQAISADRSLTAAKASATVSLGALSTTYDGTPKTITTTTTPAGLATTVTYAGASTAPTDAGTYAVVATINDTTYQGTASGTLTIAQATQSITFTPPTAIVVGTPVTLTATASSGLPVTFAVVSGPATLSGDQLTVTESGTVILRATQAGNANYQAASVTRTLGDASKLSQSITFSTPADKLTSDAPFTLSATASSGLPVSFAVVSGPALLSGTTLTLTGAPGAVLIRASQAGNTVYQPADDVTRTLTVTSAGPLVYFGNLASGNTSGAFAANLRPEGNSGTMIGIVPGTGEGFVVDFTPDAAGNWVSTSVTFSSQAASAEVPATLRTSEMIGRLASRLTTGATSSTLVTTTRTFRGRVNGTALSGSIDGTSVTFAATLLPPTGPTAAVAGYYESESLQTSIGTVYSIIGPTNQIYVLATTTTYIGGGTGTTSTNGSFSVTADSASITGTVDATTTTLTGAVTLPTGTTETFAGVAVTTVRTDRLIGLSSRGRITASVGQLIAGFSISGQEAKTMLLRGVGPTLANYGVTGAIAATRLRLYDGSGQLLREVDGWKHDSAIPAAFARTGTFQLAATDLDSALLVRLEPGAYTVHVAARPGATGNNATTGIVLAEIYDASVNPQAEYQRLGGISSRGLVGTGENVLIGGFTITGNSPKRVLIRGIGPGLDAYGVANALTDPSLTLHSGETVIARNDNWETPITVGAAQVATPAAIITAASKDAGTFPLAAGSRDAAIVITLAPGSYTAQVATSSGVTGEALIEIYEITTEL